MRTFERTTNYLTEAVLASRDLPGGENIQEHAGDVVKMLDQYAKLGGALPIVCIMDVASAVAGQASELWNRSRAPQVPRLEPPPSNYQSTSSFLAQV
jgi:hypothetical protein